MSSGETLEKQLSEFRKKQLEAEFERRQRRNKEVDDLIQNIGDPRIAEKLRIYRLVEQKFLAVELQVEIEVKKELAKKKSALASNTGLKEVERVLKKPGLKAQKFSDLDLVPVRLSKTASPVSVSQPGVLIKYRPKSLEHIAPPRKTVSSQCSSTDDSDGLVPDGKPFILDKASIVLPHGSKPISRATARTGHLSKVPKPVPFLEVAKPVPSLKVAKPVPLPSVAKPVLPLNVGLVDYVYQDTDFRRRQWMKLSAHLLQGVDIRPQHVKPVNHLVRTLLDSSDHKVFISTSGYQDGQDDSPRQLNISVVNKSKQINAIPDQIGFSKDKNCPETLSTSPVQLAQSDATNVSKIQKESEEMLSIEKPVLNEDKRVDAESRSSSSYSMEFEEDDEDIQHNPVFLDRFPDFQGSLGSITDRLSTIPEDSRSHELEELDKIELERLAEANEHSKLETTHRLTRLQEVSSIAEDVEAEDVKGVEDVECESPSDQPDNASKNSLSIPRPVFGQRPLSSSSKERPKESSVTQYRVVSDRTDHHIAPMASANSEPPSGANSGRPGPHLSGNLRSPLRSDSGHTEDDLDPMSITQSAKAMLDMLDEMSLSEGVLSDVSFGMFEQDGSNRINLSTGRHEFAARASPRRNKTNFMNSKQQATNSSSHSTSNSSVPLYSASTSYTSATTSSMDAELSEEQPSNIL